MSLSAMALRRATFGDAAGMLKLIHAAFEEYRDKLHPPSSAHAERLETIEKLLETEIGIVAEVNGALAGSVFYDVRQESVYLHRLAVLPEFRRHGIGKALVMQVEKDARSLGKTRVTLGVRVALPENRAYYEKLGFAVTEFEFHPGFLQFTSVSMAKELSTQTLRHVQVVPHDPRWKELFESEAELLHRVFGAQLLAIHHVGSTAIPGIHAKPIIDIMPIVKEIRRVYAFDPTMLALGYQPLGENGIAGRRFYRKGGRSARSHHLHVYEAYNPEVDQHLAFRDYLIAHPKEAQRYSELKQRLAQQHPHDIKAYMDGKDGLIKELLGKAKKWWGGKGMGR